ALANYAQLIILSVLFFPFREQTPISRHVWAECVEEADHLRHTEENKRIYAERKETIERVFADLKEKHGMRWTTLRGLKRVTMQAMLVFSAMNLKRMATWLWKRGRPSDKFNFVFEIGITNIKNSRYCSISRDFVFNLISIECTLLIHV
ncbi:transposase, partial [Paenibacillus larvae]